MKLIKTIKWQLKWLTQCTICDFKKLYLFSKLNFTLNLIARDSVVLIVKGFQMFDQAATCTDSNNRKKKKEEEHTKATTGRLHWIYCDSEQ